LENHGLDRCPDHGIKGFKRYVGLFVLAKNLQIMRHNIQQKGLIQLQWPEQRKVSKNRLLHQNRMADTTDVPEK